MNSPTAPPASGRTAARLFAAGAFAGAAVAIVWLGFAGAGLGADAHPPRVLAAAVPPFACGLVLSWPRSRPSVRVLVVLLGLADAALAWWFVPCRAGGMSLRSANSCLAEIDVRASRPLLDDVWTGFAAEEGLQLLERDFPSLAGGRRQHLSRWIGESEVVLTGRYRQLPPDDVAAVQELGLLADAVGERDPAVLARLRAEQRVWVARAVEARAGELANIPPCDWGAFDRTAAGRHALSDAFPEARGSLADAEGLWAYASVLTCIERSAPAAPGGRAPRAATWRAIEAEVLALRTLDASDGRLLPARKLLFERAHSAVRDEARMFINSGQFSRANGAARKHAVDWHATAAALGPSELRKLDELRKPCTALAAVFGDFTPPEPLPVAPHPREKP